MSCFITRRWSLVILFLLALVCRFYRASQMPVAMPDAIRHVEQAQRLANDPLGAVREEVYHPLHSLAILGVERVWNAVHPIASDVASQRLAWVHTAQGVGIFFGALMAPLLFLLARRLGARPWAAACAAVAWMVARRTSAYGIDGMSDMLALCLFTVSMLFALRCMPGRRGSLNGRQVAGIFVAGIFAGLAYLTRPEGLAAPLMVSLAWLVSLAAAAVGGRFRAARQIRQEWKTFPRQAPAFRAVAAALLILWAGVAIPAAPYAVAIGGITQKKQLIATQAQAVEAREGKGAAKNPIVWVWLEIAKTFGYVPMTILLVTMVIAPAGWGRALSVAHAGVGGAVDGGDVLAAPGARLPERAAYADSPGAAICSAGAGAAADRDAGVAGDHEADWHRATVYVTAAYTGGAVGVFRGGSDSFSAGTAAATMAGDVCSGERGIMGAARLDETCVVADRQLVVGYYSMHSYVRWWGNPDEAARLEEKSGAPVILGKFFEHATNNPPELPRHHPIATFTEGDSLYILYEPTPK